MKTMSENSKLELIQIIKNEEWLMEALRNVRSLKLPDWYIAAGAIRNTVWNVLHGYGGDSNIKDIDVAYFDILDTSGKRETESENELRKFNPSLMWEVKNQARKSIMRSKINSSSESIAYWSEISTCVGIRLEKDYSIVICAPHGIEDLMNLIVRPIPIPYQNLDLYKKRVEEKGWEKTWPKLKIEKI